MGQFTVVSLGLLAMFLSLSGAKGDNCPASWISRNGVCNKLFPDRKTWLEAEDISNGMMSPVHPCILSSASTNSSGNGSFSCSRGREAPGEVWRSKEAPLSDEISALHLFASWMLSVAWL
uniref:Lectoxin-Enh10 n=1 Tax=Pseudoferania polylepis TaxID=338839 RepID=A7XQ60_PSEPL|nr:lectoxin-Enh10 [Pseudoferania polylepis]